VDESPHFDAARVYRLCRLFIRVVEQIVQAEARELPRTNGQVTAVQYRALEFIQLHPGCCINNLADGLATSHPAALTLVERLENHMLVRRRRSEHDHRMIELYTTRQGRDCVQCAHDKSLEIINKVFRQLSSNNGFTFDKVLHEFIEVAANSTANLPPICLHCGDQHSHDCPLAKTSVSRP